jgi:hypothetical protein
MFRAPLSVQYVLHGIGDVALVQTISLQDKAQHSRLVRMPLRSPSIKALLNASGTRIPIGDSQLRLHGCVGALDL